jgi:hypothetical protein
MNTKKTWKFCKRLKSACVHPRRPMRKRQKRVLIALGGHVINAPRHRESAWRRLASSANFAREKVIPGLGRPRHLPATRRRSAEFVKAAGNHGGLQPSAHLGFPVCWRTARGGDGRRTSFRAASRISCSTDADNWSYAERSRLRDEARCMTANGAVVCAEYRADLNNGNASATGFAPR